MDPLQGSGLFMRADGRWGEVLFAKSSLDTAAGSTLHNTLCSISRTGRRVYVQRRLYNVRVHPAQVEKPQNPSKGFPGILRAQTFQEPQGNWEVPGSPVKGFWTYAALDLRRIDTGRSDV